MDIATLRRPMPTRPLTLRRAGAEDLKVTVRALTLGEIQRMRIAHPRPQPDLTPDPRGNPDRMPLIPKTNCPHFNAHVGRWQYQTMALEASASLGLEVESIAYRRGMPEKDLEKWVAAVLRAFGLHTGTVGGGDSDQDQPPLTAGELSAICATIEELGDLFGGDEGARIEDAKKSLSGLSPTGLEQVRAELDRLASASPNATA